MMQISDQYAGAGFLLKCEQNLNHLQLKEILYWNFQFQFYGKTEQKIHAAKKIRIFFSSFFKEESIQIIIIIIGRVSLLKAANKVSYSGTKSSKKMGYISNIILISIGYVLARGLLYKLAVDQPE